MNKLSGYQTLIPAYGQDYKNAKEAKEAFLKGKDFVLQSFQGSTYCSIRDFALGSTANLRYKGLRSVTPVKVTFNIPEGE